LAIHIAFVGWWFDARKKKYRPALLVPVILTFYQIGIILTNSRSTRFNEPNVKFFVLLIIAILLGINYYFNYKKEVQSPNHFQDDEQEDESL
jgi:UDP-N-acetylmuramyl pentapeptide phosphotransferase/UDP-N-acetylglucosamine-1-phosphate transferase